MNEPKPFLKSMRRGTIKASATVAVAALYPGLVGCAGPLSTLDPAGPSAASIATLFWVMLIGAGLLFLLVITLLLAMLLRPGFGSRFSPRNWIVWGGLAMPAAILLALVVFALAMGERLIASPLRDAPLVVEARADQWRWTFSYPETTGAGQTENVLHLPAGEPVDIRVTSDDVIHSFWIPRLGGKIDAIPGHENTIRLMAERPGIYRGVCAEFCGTGHSNMNFRVEAHAPETYEAAVRGELDTDSESNAP